MKAPSWPVRLAAVLTLGGALGVAHPEYEEPQLGSVIPLDTFVTIMGLGQEDVAITDVYFTATGDMELIGFETELSNIPDGVRVTPTRCETSRSPCVVSVEVLEEPDGQIPPITVNQTVHFRGHDAIIATSDLMIRWVPDVGAPVTSSCEIGGVTWTVPEAVVELADRGPATVTVTSDGAETDEPTFQLLNPPDPVTDTFVSIISEGDGSWDVWFDPNPGPWPIGTFVATMEITTAAGSCEVVITLVVSEYSGGQ